MDITEQKRAEDALHQAQTDLAHVSRVTTLGQMAASIAHEVDQPLSGIIINANACLRFLTSTVAKSRRSARGSAGHRPRRPAVERRDRANSSAGAPNRHRGGAVGRRRAHSRGCHPCRRRSAADRRDRPDGALAGISRVCSATGSNCSRWCSTCLLNGLEAMHAVVGRPRELVIRYATGGNRSRLGTPVQDSGLGIDPQACGPPVRGLLHHEARRDGDGALDQPVDCRAARRRLGPCRMTGRHDVPVHGLMRSASRPSDAHDGSQGSGRSSQNVLPPPASPVGEARRSDAGCRASRSRPGSLPPRCNGVRGSHSV